MCERGQEAPTASHLSIPAEEVAYITRTMFSSHTCKHVLPGSGCSDITYISVRRRFLYLVTIMDWATRKMLAWRLSNTLHASFCVEALEEAIAKFGKPEIFNTDSYMMVTSSRVV